MDDATNVKIRDYRDPKTGIVLKEGFQNKYGSITLGEYYVDRKYESLKEEMLFNSICFVAECQWNAYIEKANIYIKTDKVRNIKCPRKQSATYYEMEFGEGMNIGHLVAMMVHCNNDQIQYQFNQTFRKLEQNETIHSIKQRHANYYWFGRLLRENVEAFGMNKNNYNYKPFHIRLYRGVNKHFTFSSLSAYIPAPFSMTTDYFVAANFSQNKGIILEIEIKANSWCFKYDEGEDALERITCFEAFWLSDFSNEREIFCIGGLNAFYIDTIIEPDGTNYDKYIKGLKQITKNMSTTVQPRAYDISIDPASTRDEQQMVFRLLSHELYGYYPNHEKAHKFESCPNYFKQILHSQCSKIVRIRFEEIENKVIDLFFKYDNEWINLHLLSTVFPNIQFIHYMAMKKPSLFVIESSIIESVLLFIDQNRNSSLKLITILMNTENKDVISRYIKKYEKDFQKYSWSIHLIDFDFVGWALNHVKSIGFTEEKMNDIATKQYGATKCIELQIKKNSL